MKTCGEVLVEIIESYGIDTVKSTRPISRIGNPGAYISAGFEKVRQYLIKQARLFEMHRVGAAGDNRKLGAAYALP